MKINYYQIEAEKEKFHTALLGLFLYWEVWMNMCVSFQNP
jgi:hypothetical protein